ncbi:MAG: FAD-dependent oxidoreductase, partial [Pseudolabrys sp.]
MARTDAMVLGAGIVGTSVALHLVRRGMSVALIDRTSVGEQTSYGNAGIIEGNTIFPPAFPSDVGSLVRIALKRASEANYHLSFLPQVLPWLLAFRAASRPERLAETARLIRPLFSRAVAEHEVLMAEAGATHYLRKTGWLKVYRGERSFAALRPEFDLAAKFGLPLRALDTAAAQVLEPSLHPVLAHAVFWPSLLLYLGGVLWTLGSDTIYAHQDKEDDIRIGVKSSALALGAHTRPWLFAFYGAALLLWSAAGHAAGLGAVFWAGLAAVGVQLAWQAAQVATDNPADCLRKFRSNRAVGWLMLVGIVCGHLG